MDFWRLIYFIDITLFIFVSATVLYLAVFALASLFSKHTDVPRAKTQNRFIILIPVYKNGIGAEHTVRAALGQSYPQRLFDLRRHPRLADRDGGHAEADHEGIERPGPGSGAAGGARPPVPPRHRDDGPRPLRRLRGIQRKPAP